MAQGSAGSQATNPATATDTCRRHSIFAARKSLSSWSAAKDLPSGIQDFGGEDPLLHSRMTRSP